MFPEDGAAGQHKSGQRERELSGLWSTPWGVFQATLASISPPRGLRPRRHAIASRAKASPRKWRPSMLLCQYHFHLDSIFGGGDEWDLKRVE